ncbi:MAG: hypothetical protein APF80_16625 [Alphaproteobacteria bacterium BRH_c36]|nr:MAG: hypothetical protein APF80_16625 [Alphaproteobacteria bacterium BRH_c36]
MKLNRKAAALAAVLVAGAGSAMATDQDINLTATVAGFCRIGGSLTPTADTVNLDSLVTAGFITATQTDRTYAVICNKATDISLESQNGAMTTASASALNFENVINYTASTSGFATISAGSTATTATASGPESLGSTTRATPGSANIVVSITPIGNTDPLVEGVYQDTLRLSITPQ